MAETRRWSVWGMVAYMQSKACEWLDVDLCSVLTTDDLCYASELAASPPPPDGTQAADFAVADLLEDRLKQKIKCVPWISHVRRKAAARRLKLAWPDPPERL